MNNCTVITGRGVVLPEIFSIEAMENVMNNGQTIVCESDNIIMGINSDVEVKGYLKNRKVKRFLSRSEKMADRALKSAVEEAKLNEATIASDRKCIFLGNTKESGPKEDLVEVINHIYNRNENKIMDKKFADTMSNLMSPLFVVEAFPNACLHYFAEEYGIHGANSQFMNNNIASLQALNEAHNSIVYGESDIAIVGGYDSYLSDELFNVLAENKIISNSKNRNEFESSFMKNRKAPFISEGSGMLVLEEKKHALKRGVNILGEVVGCKQLFINKKHPEEEIMNHLGSCIKSFLERIRVEASNIKVIHIDASSESFLENLLSKVINQIFPNTFLVDTKANFGSTIAANGAISLLALLSILQNQVIPPAILTGEIDAHYKDNIVVHESRKEDIHSAMSISIGFEGEVALTVLKKSEQEVK